MLLIMYLVYEENKEKFLKLNQLIQVDATNTRCNSRMEVII